MIESIDDYLEKKRRDYLTDEFAYSSYHAPNTMYQVANGLDDVILTLSFGAMKMWHKSLSLLKRNKKSSIACSVIMEYDTFEKVVSRNVFFKAKKELCDKQLLLPTTKRTVYIVNIDYACKAFRPKIDLEL